MAVSRNLVVSAEVGPDNTAIPKSCWEKVLDDPSLRRLLRDGHRPEATATLLEQLEEDV